MYSPSSAVPPFHQYRFQTSASSLESRCRTVPISGICLLLPTSRLELGQSEEYLGLRMEVDSGKV
jgi:hypothetical protein